LPLAADANTAVAEDDVAELEAEYLTGTKAAQEHAMGDCEVPIAREAAEERSHLLSRERLDELTWLLDAELEDPASPESVNAEVVITTGPLVVRRGQAQARA
jgi:hypothetical protein